MVDRVGDPLFRLSRVAIEGRVSRQEDIKLRVLLCFGFCSA